MIRSFTRIEVSEMTAQIVQAAGLHEFRQLMGLFFGLWVLLAVVPGLPLVIKAPWGSTWNKRGWALQKYLSIDLLLGGLILSLMELLGHGHPSSWSDIGANIMDGTRLTLGLGFMLGGVLLKYVIKRLAPPEDPGWRGAFQ